MAAGEVPHYTNPARATPNAWEGGTPEPDDPLGSRALQDALRGVIADRGGYVAWDVDHAGWVVELLAPERERFYGRTLGEALAWCLVWLMADEPGVGGFAEA